jgi:hypothetical protein
MITFEQCLVLGTEAFLAKFQEALDTDCKCAACKRSGSFLRTIEAFCDKSVVQRPPPPPEIIKTILSYIKQIAATNHVVIVILPTLQVSPTYYDLGTGRRLATYTIDALVRIADSIQVDSAQGPDEVDWKYLCDLLLLMKCEFWCVYVGANNKVDWFATDLFTELTTSLNAECKKCKCPLLNAALEVAVRETLKP